MTLNELVLAVGAFYFYPRIIGTLLNACIFSIVMICSITATFRGVHDVFGRYCAMNVAPVEHEGGHDFKIDGRTYKDDARTMKTLMII